VNCFSTSPRAGSWAVSPFRTRLLSAGLLAFLIAAVPANRAAGQPPAETNSPSESADAPAKFDGAKSAGKSTAKAKTPWRSLEDHWVACSFGGEGEVKIRDGLIQMGYGQPLTGVRWDGPFTGQNKPEGAGDATASDQNSNAGEAENRGSAATAGDDRAVKPLPRDNYELRWQCRRDRGFDFLCAFTFPIADEYASLVMGGWGGGVTGISSIDGRDASDNETTMFQAYENERWYQARVRVDPAKITVWIDGTLMFDHPRKGHDFDIRFEMDPCTPLGIANYECDSQIRNIEIRNLHRSEIAGADADGDGE